MVAALTNDEKEYIRSMAGDSCTTPTIGDALLEKFWQRTDGSECKTIVYLLRALIADAQTKYDQGNRQSGEYQSRNQVAREMRKTLADWERRCGMSGGALSVGVMDLGIDQEVDS